MLTIDWDFLGMKNHSDLIKEITLHNNQISKKIRYFDEIIDASQVKKKDEYLDILNEHRNTLEIITTYHDIGKVRGKLNHGEHSADIIQETNVLDQHNINDFMKALVKSVVRHHLMLGTIYTGEWSVKKMYLLNKRSLKEENLFLRILAVFSAVDTWAYINDRNNIIRLFRNYDRIIERFQNDSVENHIKANLIWRFCCFLGAWRSLDYLDERNMIPFEQLLSAGISRYNNYEQCNIREVIWKRFKRLQDVNFNYAIWLLSNCCFDNISDYERNNISTIRIDNSLFFLMEEVVSTLESHEPGFMWDILFTGYRESKEKAASIFRKMKVKNQMNNVVKGKVKNIQNHQVVYNFDLLSCT